MVKPDENRNAPGAGDLFDEFRNAVTQRVDLKYQGRPDAFLFAQPIIRSRMDSQFLLRAKLSSVTKKFVTPWAALARRMASTSSAVRCRDLRP